MCSVVVESWYEKQYTCLVVKRRTAASSPATGTIIAPMVIRVGHPRVDHPLYTTCSPAAGVWFKQQR